MDKFEQIKKKKEKKIIVPECNFLADIISNFLIKTPLFSLLTEPI